MRAWQTPAPGVLRRRVPNPPMCFVGRDEERARVARILETSPVALVCGAGGMGKSALVRQVVRDLGQATEPIQLRARPEDDFGLFAVELAMASGLEQRGSPESLAASCLNAMEAGGCLVVVEDLHHLPPDEAARWLSLLTGYAHASRWLITSRLRPSLPDVQERVVELGPLEPDAARALAGACRPDAGPDTIAALVRAGDGSPLWIRQLSAADLDSVDLRAGLADEAARELAMLSVLREPLPRRGSERAPGLDALEQRGLFEADHAQLHDLVRERVAEQLTPEELVRARHDAVLALRRPVDPRESLERLRLQLEMADYEAAARTLEERQPWIDRGHGARLWSLLSREEAPQLRTLRMEVAVDVATNTALDWLVNQPEPGLPAQRRVWVRGLLLSGRPRRALDALESGGADDMPLLFGQALAGAGHPHRALAHLRTIEPATAADRARHALAMAKAHYHAGDEREAAVLLARARTEMSGLSGRLAEELEAESQSLLWLLGLATDPRAPMRSPEGLVFRGLRLVTSGRLARASALTSRLLNGFDLPSGSGVLAGITSGMLSIARGQYFGLDGRARRAVHDAERLGNATLYYAAYVLERAANLGRAWEVEEIPWSPSIPYPTGAPARYLTLLRACHRARRGERLEETAIPQRRPSDGPLVACVSLLAEAHVRLLVGEPERACFLASQAAAHTEDDGFGVFVGESVLTRVYAELAMGRRIEVDRGCDELLRVAERLDSGRYRVLASLLRLAVPPEPDIGALLHIAQQEDRSPTAARVAQALLGAEIRPDALDRLLVTSIRASWTTGVVPLKEGCAATWVIEPAARLVHGTEGSFELSPLSIRLLDGLFAQGGHATLSELARIGWGLDDFHPLRDSKRIHVAIGRLRKGLEDDPSAPTRVITTEHGYGLGVNAPVGRWEPASV